MEHCSKCNGVMLEMKTKKTILPESERKQVFKCSRCGYYLEKQSTFRKADEGSFPHLNRQQS